MPWRDYCEVFLEGSTYNLKNMVKMKYSGEIRFQTVHNKIFTLADDQIVDYMVPPAVVYPVLSNVQITAVEDLRSFLFPGANTENNLIKCRSCLKVKLSYTVKRKNIRHITVGTGHLKRKLTCHDDPVKKSVSRIRILK